MDVRITPETAPERLGFTHVRGQVARLCTTPAAKALAEALHPTAERNTLAFEHTLLAEVLALTAQGHAFPLTGLSPVQPLFAAAQVEGNHLSLPECQALRKWLETTAGIAQFLERHSEYAPNLLAHWPASQAPAQLLEALGKFLNPAGELRPDASPTLQRLRRDRAAQSEAVRKVLASLLNEARDRGWSTAEAPALRNDRLTLPLKASHQNAVPGFVQDVSATGQTVYLEPAQVLALNNRIRELEAAERHEIRRILVAFTDALRPHLPALGQVHNALTELDFRHAKAQWGIQVGGILPAFAEGLDLDLREARHPALLRQKTAQHVVPLNVQLSAEKRWLVISGPNAGGKSVALKTVGLLQLVAQSGLPIPVAEGSRLPVLRQVFADIGDEQSMQDDLSTYTAHLTHLKQFLETATPHTLVLLDEFGTGTDPALGGPLAEALLDGLAAAGPMGVVTTHYANLKEWAERHPAAQNGAMQFDPTLLKPTYRLRQGIPGSSYAFEIAARVGIPHRVLRQARELAGTYREASEQLVQELQQRQLELEARDQEVRQLEAQLEEKLASTTQRAEDLARKKEAVLEAARAEAKALLEEANRSIERTIREIRERDAEKEATKVLRRELRKTGEKLTGASKKHASSTKKAPDAAVAPTGELRLGGRVRVRSTGAEGILESLDTKRARVSVGQLTLTVQPTDLEPLAAGPAPTKRPTRTVRARPLDARLKLDLRGKRVEEALPLLNAFIDDATIAGLERLEILHGKGTFVLRDAVRRHLRSEFRHVHHLADAEEEFGGSGITVVQLKYR